MNGIDGTQIYYPPPPAQAQVVLVQQSVASPPPSQNPDQAYRAALEMARQWGLGMSVPSSGSMEDYNAAVIAQMRQLQALRAQAGLNHAQPRNGNGNAKEGNLTVKGHDRFDASGQRIPVVSETISKSGNWNSRQTTWNQGQYNPAEAHYRGTTGGYYTITVTWADGQTVTKQVHDHGYPVDIY